MASDISKEFTLFTQSTNQVPTTKEKLHPSLQHFTARKNLHKIHIYTRINKSKIGKPYHPPTLFPSSFPFPWSRVASAPPPLRLPSPPCPPPPAPLAPRAPTSDFRWALPSAARMTAIFPNFFSDLFSCRYQETGGSLVCGAGRLALMPSRRRSQARSSTTRCVLFLFFFLRCPILSSWIR
jgi:hypothetical protein